ncbi:MAG: MFS transporter [Opitutaceae bacterium]
MTTIPTAAQSRPLPGAWLVVILLWFVAGVNWSARGLIVTMHDSVTAAIPMTNTQFGLLTSCFAWTYGLLSPFAGFLADRFSRSRVIVVSLIAWSVLTWLTAYARNFNELLALRILLGISECTYLPASLALITDYHRTTTRSVAVGLHMSGISVGASLSGIGGWLAERHTWNYPFQLVGLIGVSYGLVLIFVLRDAPKESVSSTPVAVSVPVASFREALASLFGRRAFILLLSYYGLAGFVGWAILGWMPTFIHEHFNLGQGAAGFSASGYVNIANLCGVFVGGILADRWSRTHPRACILVPAIALCFAGPGIFLTANTDLIYAAMFGLVAFGFAGGFSDANMMPILCVVGDTRYRATAYGILNFAGCLCGGLAIYAAGALRDLHLSSVQILNGGAAVMLLCPIFLFLIRPPVTPVANP